MTTQAPHWDNRSLPRSVMGALTMNGLMVAICPSGPSTVMGMFALHGECSPSNPQDDSHNRSQFSVPQPHKASNDGNMSSGICHPWMDGGHLLLRAPFRSFKTPARHRMELCGKSGELQRHRRCLKQNLCQGNRVFKQGVVQKAVQRKNQ